MQTQQFTNTTNNEQKSKMFPLNPALNFLGTEVSFNFSAEVAKVEKSGKFPKIYKFHIGDTGPRTADAIISVAMQALKDKQTKYGLFQGYPSVRENIANYLSKRHGADIKAENILLMPGGKPAIELTMQTLIGPKDYVVGQNPGYPIYESLARFYGENRYLPWLARYSEQNKKLEFHTDDLEKILNEYHGRVKVLAVNTPQNPTGMMLPKETVRKIAELAMKYKFMVLFDDIYDQIVFGGREHYSLLSIPGMLDYTINLNGYSKDFAMTGWRLGYVAAPKWLIEVFGKLAINKWSCVNTVNQIVAGAIFGDVEVNGKTYKSVADEIAPLIKADVAEYERKGNFLVNCLRLLEPYVVPNEVEGAFYEFPRVEKLLELPYVKKDLNIKNDVDFRLWLLHERGFACLAGSDFGPGGKGHIRLSYAEDINEHIIPGVQHFMKIVIELVEKSGLTAPLRMGEVEGRVRKKVDKYFRKYDFTMPDYG